MVQTSQESELIPMNTLKTLYYQKLVRSFQFAIHDKLPWSLFISSAASAGDSSLLYISEGLKDTNDLYEAHVFSWGTAWTLLASSKGTPSHITCHLTAQTATLWSFTLSLCGSAQPALISVTTACTIHLYSSTLPPFSSLLSPTHFFPPSHKAYLHSFKLGFCAQS